MWKTDYIYRNDIAKNLPIFKSELWFRPEDVENKNIFLPVPFLFQTEVFEGFYRFTLKNYVFYIPEIFKSTKEQGKFIKNDG